MNRTFLIICVIYISVISCNKPDVNKAKAEIFETELAFAQMVKDSGYVEAFYYFADDSAVIKRTMLVKGREAIKAYLSNQNLSDVKLEWKPDFVDVASTGGLGYTYGNFTFYAIAQNGDTLESTGFFHTVWKKQPDGSWKYVWD